MDKPETMVVCVLRKLACALEANKACGQSLALHAVVRKVADEIDPIIPESKDEQIDRLTRERDSSRKELGELMKKLRDIVFGPVPF